MIKQIRAFQSQKRKATKKWLWSINLTSEEIALLQQELRDKEKKLVNFDWRKQVEVKEGDFIFGMEIKENQISDLEKGLAP